MHNNETGGSMCRNNAGCSSYNDRPRPERKDPPVAEQSFGMYNILIYTPYSFQIMHDEERNKNEERQEERR